MTGWKRLLSFFFKGEWSFSYVQTGTNRAPTMTIARWDLILTLMTLVFVIVGAVWLKYAIDEQLKSKRRNKYRRK